MRKDPITALNELLDDKCETIEKLSSENDALRAALNEYADEKNWAYTYEWCGYEGDGYTIAQKALKETK